MGDASRIAEGADIAANINKAKTLAEAGNLAKQEPVIAEGAANAAANAAKGEQNAAKVGEAVAGAPKGGTNAAKGIGTAKELGIPKFLSPRQQMHIPPVSDGRSVLTSDPAALLQGLHDGSFKILRQPKSGQVIVDFGKPIGEYWSNGVKVGETQFGSVLFGKNGAHIIPANPKQW